MVRGSATHPEIADASPYSSTGSMDAFWGRLLLRLNPNIFQSRAAGRRRFVLEPRGSRRGLPNYGRHVVPSAVSGRGGLHLDHSKSFGTAAGSITHSDDR